MTEAQWLTDGAPAGMFHLVRPWASGRKLRLFVVACCDRIAPLFPDDRIRRALDAAERLADAAIDVSDRAAAETWVRAVRAELNPQSDARRWDAATAALIAVSRAFWPKDAARLASIALVTIQQVVRDSDGSVTEVEAAAEAHLLRDLFGNPFRPVTFSPEWRTDTAVLLARTMYEAHEFSAMPILADALQDAGCDNDEILNHCRGDGPHVRGCWVVDAVLSKE